jgi:hypothetical protein
MYITPRVKIQQEFTQLPVYREFPLPAFIIGPHFSLNRYSVASEKPFIAVGTLDGAVLTSSNNYNYLENVTYDFPNVPAGGDVDHDYTKVFAEAVEAQYFPLEALGSTGADDDLAYVSSSTGFRYKNRVRFTGVTLKSTAGYSRSSVFSNRDVSVGDVIEITDGTTIFKSKIKGLYSETASEDSDLDATVAASLYSGSKGATTSNGFTLTDTDASFVASEVVGKYVTVIHVNDSNGVYKIIGCPNSTTLTLDRSTGSVAKTNRNWFIGGVYGAESNARWECAHLNNSVSATNGTSNSTVVLANTSSDYEGYVAKGIVEDTYSFKVTTGGDLATARFSVSSQAGAFTTKLDVALVDSGSGTYTLTLDSANGNNVTVSFTAGGSPADLQLGNSWELFIGAEVNPISSYDGAITVNSTYTGKTDMIYTLKVERGGPLFDGTNGDICARVVVSASNIDTTKIVSPRINGGVGVPFSVGSFGVTAAFNTTPAAGGLILGDIYYIPVSAEKTGKVSVVELTEDLSTMFLTTEPSLTAKLYLTQKSIEIPAVRDLLTGESNWTQEGNYITVNAGISTYDTKLAVAGEPVILPVTAAKLFVEHRDLLQNFTGAIDSVTDLASVTAKLGTVHPDNPLAQGVYDAVLNAQNQVVYFIAVGTNDLAGYTQAIKVSEKSDKVYSFVPLTFDRTVQDAVVSHVNAYSTPDVGRWRVAWLGVQDAKNATVYSTKTDGSNYTATVTDDPTVSGTQYRYVTVEDAQFVTDVRPNDSVRLNFRLGLTGKVEFDEYTVDRVLTNNTLILTKSLPAAISSPIKVEIVRNYTLSERASNIAAYAGSYNNRRVRVVFPDTYKYGGVVKQGYFAAAGLAGLRSGVVPHQGLTNSEFLGADDLSKVVLEFTQENLDTMAEQGVWILSQEVVGATPYVRHQLTSDSSSLNTSEDSITTNVDSISYALKATLAPFIGKYNINPETLVLVGNAVSAELLFRSTGTRTERAGNQLTSFTPKDDILLIQQNPVYKDRIDLEVRLNVPYPMNYINLKLIV